MNYESIRLDKSLYKADGGFSAQLERLDPSANYTGTELSGLDAFQRQLKRFDIRVSGKNSDNIAKFFQTSDSAALFPEYVSRAVAQGTKAESLLEEIVASKTEIQSLDYRSITTELDDDLSDTIGEGEKIPETKILLNDYLIRLVKRGRILSTSYEAIRFQRSDVVTVALGQIGAHIAKARMRDAVEVLINGTGNIPAAASINTAGSSLAYADLLRLWNEFTDFDMNVMLASPDMMMQVLSLAEFKDPASALNFQNSGSLGTPMGAKLLKSAAVPAGTMVAMDKRFALEMVTCGDIQVEYDKLIDTQLERAAVTSIYGFSKIFPEAVKVLKLA
ncbi:MAG: phage major capsid protein [Oscillospiraceae bacterium]|nr:phage major capsid protein [Oscillospiraceae bacterium]